MLYFLKRILLFVPTIAIISFLAFGLSQCTSGDPVLRQLPPETPFIDSYAALQSYEGTYRRMASTIGADLPPFYFSFENKAYPDTFYQIPFKAYRGNLKNLLNQSGNWPATSAYYQAIKEVQKQALLIGKEHKSNPLIEIKARTEQLLVFHKPPEIQGFLDSMTALVQQDSMLDSGLQPAIENLNQQFQNWKSSPTKSLLYTPKFRWNGFGNQYHKWIMNFMGGDLGHSYRYERPVFDVIKDALRWTLLINITALILAYLLSIPIGVYGAVYKDSRKDRWMTIFLFLLYSLPSFWVATLLAKFFTTPDWYNLFPSMGVGEVSPGASWWDVFTTRFHHLFLPVLCITYPALAFLSRQVRSSMLGVLSADYIRTAKAKGLSKNKVIWKHGFRNGLFPIITLLGNVLPSAIAGSVLIEIIFTIPGMGKLLVDSILANDWPIVYALLMITALLTVAGLLIADLLYTLSDPRVSFDKSTNTAS